MGRNADIYQQVTDRFIAALEAGTVPWHKPWALTKDFNPVTGTQYKGINVLLLALTKMDADKAGAEYGNLWSTYRGWQKLNGNVRKGEKGTTIVFWDVRQKPTGEVAPDGTPLTESLFLLRTYTVFNIAQTDGVELPAKYQQREDLPALDAEAVAEALLALMPNRPTEVTAPDAWYRMSDDTVGIPARASFDSPADYWATRFHEYVHSTGHADRQDRKGAFGNGFGTDKYSREELVAEVGSAFLLARVGLLDGTFDNNAAYVAGWLKALRDDPKMLVKAAADAERAADYIAPMTVEDAAAA